MLKQNVQYIQDLTVEKMHVQINLYAISFSLIKFIRGQRIQM